VHSQKSDNHYQTTNQSILKIWQIEEQGGPKVAEASGLFEEAEFKRNHHILEKQRFGSTDCIAHPSLASLSFPAPTEQGRV
jgi:hypothetical protein